MPGTFWPDHTKEEKAKCWRASIKDYVARFPWDKGKRGVAAPAYLVEQGGFVYSMNVPMISKLLPKGSIQDYQESDDELPRRTNQPDSDDPGRSFGSTLRPVELRKPQTYVFAFFMSRSALQTATHP